MKEEMDMVDTMRYKFKNIVGQSVSFADTPHFCGTCFDDTTTTTTTV